MRSNLKSSELGFRKFDLVRFSKFQNQNIQKVEKLDTKRYISDMRKIALENRPSPQGYILGRLEKLRRACEKVEKTFEVRNNLRNLVSKNIPSHFLNDSKFKFLNGLMSAEYLKNAVYNQETQSNICVISDREVEFHLKRISEIENEISENSSWKLMTQTKNCKIYSRKLSKPTTDDKIPLHTFDVVREETEFFVVGSFEDVHANDFLKVQLDVEVRKNWDKSIKNLTIIEKDIHTETELVDWVCINPVLFK